VTGLASIKMPFWIRIVMVIAALVLAAGGGLFGYRYWTHPVTLTVAVGSIDGEASKAMSAIASRLVSTNAAVRFKVVDTGTALEAAQAFAAGKVNLAVVRGDVGDLSQGGSVVVVAHVVALIIAPPGSSIDSMEALKGHTVGVIGAEANAKLVDVLSKEYGLVQAKVFQGRHSRRRAARASIKGNQRSACCDPFVGEIFVAGARFLSAKCQNIPGIDFHRFCRGHCTSRTSL
jgi:hypothetical protein